MKKHTKQIGEENNNGWTEQQLVEMVGDNRLDQLAFVTGCTKSQYTDPSHPELSGYIISRDTLEKFARVLIAECASVGFKAAYPHAGVNVLTAIKQHFDMDDAYERTE